MDRNSPALARQAVLGKTGVVPPGLIDEIEGAVAPVARGQRRDGVDRHLKLSFGLATDLLGPPSFGVLDLQRRVESFEFLNRRLQVIARAPERLCCAPLRRVQRNHERGRDRKQNKARYVLERHRDRMHRWQEKVIESRNGERGREQARADAAKPGREHDRAEKQGYERSGLQEPVQQQPGDDCRDNGQSRHCVAHCSGWVGPPRRTGPQHFPASTKERCRYSLSEKRQSVRASGSALDKVAMPITQRFNASKSKRS